MRGKNFLDTEVEANRWGTFELKSVEMAGPFVAGKDVPVKIVGILTVKQKPVEHVVDATIGWIRLPPEQVEAQKRFGFGGDSVKVRAKFATAFTDHGMQVPQILTFKVTNDIQLETDLVFTRAQSPCCAAVRPMDRRLTSEVPTRCPGQSIRGTRPPCGIG